MPARHAFLQAHLGLRPPSGGCCNGLCDLCGPRPPFTVFETLSLQQWSSFANDPVHGLLSGFAAAKREGVVSGLATPQKLIVYWRSRTDELAVKEEDKAACILINLLVRGALQVGTVEVPARRKKDAMERVVVLLPGFWSVVEDIEFGDDVSFDWFG